MGHDNFVGLVNHWSRQFRNLSESFRIFRQTAALAAAQDPHDNAALTALDFGIFGIFEDFGDFGIFGIFGDFGDFGIFGIVGDFGIIGIVRLWNFDNLSRNFLVSKS